MKIFLISWVVWGCFSAWGDWADVRSLRPTQFAVGFREVEAKEKELAEMKKKQLEKYLIKNPVPVVEGPRHELFILDHHHLCLALLRQKISKVPVELSAVWDVPEEEFWEKMYAARWLYLVDENGQPAKLNNLPKELGKLRDNPYRSLAYFVRKAGGFQKTATPFMEFQWAEFFRSRVKLGKTPDEFKKAIRQATDLARSPEAAHLPGYY
jgi:hypothetical protein